MRKMMKRLALAAGFVSSLLGGLMFAVEFHGSRNGPDLDRDFFLAVLSIPAALGAFFLGDWIITGRSPWTRGPKPIEKPLA